MTENKIYKGRRWETYISAHRRIHSERKDKRFGEGINLFFLFSEIIKNNKLNLNSKLKNNKISGSINELVRVAGLGLVIKLNKNLLHKKLILFFLYRPSHAHKLVKEGIRNLNDLEKIKEKLTHHQQIGLK